MIIEQSVSVDIPVSRVWAFIGDLNSVGQCVPGVESMEQIDSDRSSGTLRVRIGPVTVRFQGEVRVAERDVDTHRSVFEITAVDKRIASSVTATTTVTLDPIGDHGTDLRIHTDAAILGRLGDFGQPIMRRKADQLVAEFASNLTRALTAGAS